MSSEPRCGEVLGAGGGSDPLGWMGVERGAGGCCEGRRWVEKGEWDGVEGVSHGILQPPPALGHWCRTPGGSWGGGVTEAALTSPMSARAGFFQDQHKADCYFTNGTERVRFLERYIYNREQNVHFDSEVGYYVADSLLGKPDADYWNSQPDLLEQKRAAVDRFCRNNYRAWTPFAVERRGECVAEHFPGGQAQAKPRAVPAPFH